MTYDVVVVGGGLFGCTVAAKCAMAGRRVLLLEASGDIGGNVRIDSNGTHVHGPHLFHTNSEEVWNWMSMFQPWTQYQHRVLALVNDVPVVVPFCMHTFRHFWGCTTIRHARQILENETAPYRKDHYANACEYSLGNFGPTLSHALILPYTYKQWGKSATEVSASVVARIPLRFSWDDRYFTDKYQGVMDYGAACEEMLDHRFIDRQIYVSTTWLEAQKLGRQLVWSGRLDAFAPENFAYRSLRFTRVYNSEDLGIGQLNTPSLDVPHTRLVQARHFGLHPKCPTTVREEPAAHGHPYYPVECDGVEAAKRFARDRGVIVGGRLGSHAYFNMDQVIAQAFVKAKEALSC